MNNESNDFDDDFEHAADAYEREDYKTAYKLFLPLAEQGDAFAQYNLGLMYDQGLGVPQDYKEAFKWYRLSAVQGFPQAQTNLGVMYEKGQGVPQDYVEAHIWFTLSGSNGDKGAVANRDRVEKKMTPSQIAEAPESAEIRRLLNELQSDHLRLEEKLDIK